MFRGPQILTWTCPIRPRLVLRESHVPALSEYTGVGWLGARDVKERRYQSICDRKKGSSWYPKTVTCSKRLSSCSPHCKNHRRNASFQNLQAKGLLSCLPQSPQVTVAKITVSDFTVVENVYENVNAMSKHSDCSIYKTCLQTRKRTSLCFNSKTRPKNNSNYRQLFVRPFSSLRDFQFRPPLSSFSLHETRAHYKAAPQLAERWKYCLSVENESRCRKSLSPNLNLYNTNKETKRAGQAEEKNQVKWASVLVSLCSVEGEPAFLFTLRSSMLKGRHKGDVSFAGGKWDPSDRDVVATALREAKEELGVNVATESVWGILKPLRDRSGMLIAPVLANLGPLEELSFRPNPEEVEEIFTLSLSHLCDPQNRGYTHFRVGDKYAWTFPVFRNGKHRVWGLTAIALDQTLKLIVPP